MTALPSFPRRYLPLSDVYRRRFGCSVYKLPVAVAQTCPNREGLRGMSVCVFCDEWGSAAYPEQAAAPLAAQVARTGARLRRRYGAEKFVVYFQAYTSTFVRISRLEALLAEAVAQPDVVGVAVGTRPDCLTGSVLERLAALAATHHVSVELGLQTLDDAQLAWLARGHTRAQSLAALERLAAFPALDVCAHLMFGLPGEGDDQLRETAVLLSDRGVAGVKLHNLHVLKDTPLQRLYAQGRFTPVSLSEYARRVGVFLEHLAPWVAVHRLNAVASRWGEVVAPGWAREKLRPTEAIRAHLARVDTWQGRCHQGAPARGWVPAATRSVPAEGAPWA